MVRGSTKRKEHPASASQGSQPVLTQTKLTARRIPIAPQSTPQTYPFQFAMPLPTGKDEASKAPSEDSEDYDSSDEFKAAFLDTYLSLDAEIRTIKQKLSTVDALYASMNTLLVKFQELSNVIAQLQFRLPSPATQPVPGGNPGKPKQPLLSQSLEFKKVNDNKVQCHVRPQTYAEKARPQSSSASKPPKATIKRMLRPREASMTFGRLYLTIHDNRPMKPRGRNGKRAYAKEALKQLKIWKDVALFSLIGDSIIEVYIATARIQEVESQLAQDPREVLLPHFDRLAKPPFLKNEEKFSHNLTTRIAILYSRAKWQNLKDSVLEGIPDVMVQKIRSLVDEWSKQGKQSGAPMVSPPIPRGKEGFLSKEAAPDLMEVQYSHGRLYDHVPDLPSPARGCRRKDSRTLYF